MGLDIGQWDSAQALFEGALVKKPDERTSYLETACPGDDDLRRTVLRMVTLHEQDPTFLERPALERLLTTPLLALGDLIDGRWRIVRSVGIGGMGEVYEAEDLQHPDHPERVALKIVRPGFAHLHELKLRLRREIQLAHRITHPNVCKVHLLDEDRRPEGNLLFLVMDFLDGESLRTRLKREGALNEAFILSVAEQIAAGVDEAHGEGVIHRDLKSSNVMLVPRKDGTTRAVITDFGIAATEDEAVRPVIGTVGYMAPERLGDAGATRAADIYSFGVLLYEMVTGRLPFETDTPLDERRRLPTAPTTIRPSLARRWNRAILRCLDPSPGARFEHATDAVNALRPPRWAWKTRAAAVVALVVAAALAWQVTGTLIDRAARRRLAPATFSVAVLPFEVQETAGVRDGLIDFLAEQLQKNPLMREKWLVFSPADARQQGVTTTEQASKVFGATHALAGTVKGGGDSIIVEGRLVEAGSGRVTGMFTKTCPLDNQVCLQNGLLAAMGSVFVPRGFTSPPSPPISKQALPYYLQGMEYLRRDAFSHDIAIDFFQRALTVDPSAVLPKVALAEAYMLRYRDKGEAAILTVAQGVLDGALPGNADLPELHAAFGNLHRLQGHYADATRELQLAVQADPSNHVFHRMLGDVYEAAHQDEEAVAAFERVITLQPRYWEGYYSFAILHYRRGRFDQAAGLIERLIQWTPDHAQALAALGGIYVAMGRNVDAESVSRRSCSLRPAWACYVNLGIALQRQRRSDEAIAEYKRALAFGTPNEMLLLNLADAHAYLGRQSEARDYFRRAIARTEEGLRVNLQNTSLRAILAYCLAQVGEQSRARFEIEQALQHSPGDRTVRRYAVLTFESLGQRERALDILRGSPRQVIEELEQSWGTEQLQQDPRYAETVREAQSR
jgi:serine/threonine protein kinase/Tfp pilus assembly protein PilF